MNNTCPVCGGYIGPVTYLSSNSNWPITFCPGHKTTDVELAGVIPFIPIGREDGPELVYIPPVTGEQNYEGIAIVGEPGPETYILPVSTSVYPQNEETLWKIAQEVAETDSTCDGEEDLHGIPVNHFCPYCGNSILHADLVTAKDLVHTQNCIVTKARELMEWRKTQPKIEVKIAKPEVLQGEVDFDETLKHKARLISDAFEIPPQLIGEEVPHD